ncbi:MAG: hypothetical protein ABI743_11370 [bacterium]
MSSRISRDQRWYDCLWSVYTSLVSPRVQFVGGRVTTPSQQPKKRPQDEPESAAPFPVSPRLLLVCIGIWYAVVAYTHYREVLTHR